jgi:hypothetical protein
VGTARARPIFGGATFAVAAACHFLAGRFFAAAASAKAKGEEGRRKSGST